jgi:hypothetical protein
LDDRRDRAAVRRNRSSAPARSGDDVAPVDLDRGFADVERRVREQQLRTTPLAVGARAGAGAVVAAPPALCGGVGARRGQPQRGAGGDGGRRPGATGGG